MTKEQEYLELQVYENGTIYLNGYRLFGRKIFLSEGLLFKSYKISKKELQKSIELWN